MTPCREGHGGDAIDYGAGLAGVHVPGLSQERMVRIEHDILSKNDAYARDNRRAFAAERLFALNVVSSPGSGKTTLARQDDRGARRTACRSR